MRAPGENFVVETIVDLLLHRSQQMPEQLAFEFLETGEATTARLTYRELDARARTIAIALQARELEGERVLLFYQPGLDYITAFFGCLYAGAVAVPAYPPRGTQKLSRLQGVMANAAARLVLTTQAILDKFEGRLEFESPSLDLEWLSTDTLETATSAWCLPGIDADSLAFLQYTSGSTGTPKGVMVSHCNLLHNLQLIYDCFGHSDRSRGVIWLPPYHDMGLIGGILQPVYGGFPVTLMPPVYFLQKPLRWLKAISNYCGTTSGGPNFAYRLCVEKAQAAQPQDLHGLDLSSWEVAFNGAEPVRAETLRQFAETFAPYGFNPKAFYPCYGMAESTLIVTGGKKCEPAVVREWDRVGLERGEALTASAVLDHASALVGCGCQQSGHQLLIVDPQTKQVCDERMIGEIWVASPSVAQGYWNRPKATEECFQAYLADGQTGPFLRTGDLGFLDQGELFVTGRLKDVLIVRGQNHYPHDIEATVEQSHPALKAGAGAAVAVEVNGEERLVVIQEVERTHLRHLDGIEVMNTIRHAVTQQHQLSAYAIVLVKTGSIPKTSSGKVQRYACRAAFLSNSLAVIDDWVEAHGKRAKLQSLQSDVNSMLETLTAQTKSMSP